MIKNLHNGAASIGFDSPLYFESCASIVSQKEGDGPLGNLFDMICKDPMFGCDTWESAESTLQKEVATLAMNRCSLTPEDVQLMFAGDLLAQTAATSFGSAGIGIPFYGLYGPALPWANLSPLVPWLSLPVSEAVFYAQPPVILPARKKSSAFHLDMETSGLFLQPGLSPEAEPVS